MKSFILPFLLLSSFYANDIVKEEIEENNSPIILDINYLKTLQKGKKRDFFINEYLKKDINKEEAFSTLSLIDDMSNELFFNFSRKFKHDETLAVAQCMNMDTQNLLNSYSDCLVIGLSLEEATTLSSIDIDRIRDKTKKKYPTFEKRLKVISSSIPFTKLIISKKDEFYSIYLGVDDKFRSKYFNYKLPKRSFSKIFKDKKKFDEFIVTTVTNPNIKVGNKFLLSVEDKDLSSNSSFMLSLNAIKFNKLDEAAIFIENAIKKETKRKVLDKYLFWKFFITKDEQFLEELSTSLNLNFYSVLANELLTKPLNDTAFLETLEPFESLKETYDNKRIALLYAIAKVKSNFNSEKISDKFNIGIMQLKPALIKNISESLNKEYKIFNQLNVIESLEFSNIHLNNLGNAFTNPIFLFLAYESEIRFLNNKLNSGLFKKDNLFDVLLDFEYVSNHKKEYLKDFVLYYYLFFNKLEEDNKMTLFSIFKNLIVSDQKLSE